MKRTTYTIGSLIILLIAAFIFVLVPIFSGGKSAGRGLSFGKYDGTEIRYEQGSDFANYVSRYADYYKNQGIEINDSNYYYIFNYAFNTTVQQLAYSKAVKKSGYSVPKSAVNRAMMPYFTDETGNYSSKAYKLADSQFVADLRTNLEQSLFTQRFVEDCFGGITTLGKKALFGIKSSNAEVEFIQKLNDENVNFNLISFDMNNYPESEKIAYAKENASKFKKYELSIINCSDKAKAQSVAKRIANGEITFEDAVSEYSQKSYSNETGKMTNKYSYQIEKIFVNAEDMDKVTSLEKDAISEPLQTTIGYSIFKADEVVSDADLTDSSVISTVYNYITSNDFSRIEAFYTTKAQNFVNDAQASSFASAAKKNNLTVVNVPSSPLNYGGVSVLAKMNTSLEGLSGALTNETLLKTAYSLKKYEISKPIVNGKNIVVLQNIGTEKSSDKVSSETIIDEFASYDSSSAQEAILESPRLVNNFSDVYFNKFINNK